MKTLVHGIVAAIVFESITLFFRFYLELQSTRDTAIIAAFTGNLRIHHGYLGVLIILACLFIPSPDRQDRPDKIRIRHWLLVLGIGLVISDLLHHFVYLWLISGSPQFDLVYPQQ